MFRQSGQATRRYSLITPPRAFRRVIGASRRVRLWEAEHVIEAVLANYDALPEEIRAKLPLKRVWMLSDSGG